MKHTSFLVALFLIACGPSSGSASIVGTWRGTIATGSTTADITLTFTAEGALTNMLSARVPAGAQYPNCMVAAMQSGTYTISGDQLSVNLNAGTVVPSNCPPQAMTTTIAASMRTSRVAVTATTLTVFPPDDAALGDGSVDGGVSDNVVLTRQ